MRALLILALFVLAAFASDLPEGVTNGFYEGRSGDLLLKPQMAQQESLMMFLNGVDSKIAVPKKEMHLSETRVADLLAHLVGTAPLNPQVDRSSFPKKGFFSNPKANLLVVVDSTSIAPESGVKHGIARESYPDEPITTLTSILTGAAPSKHGIVADAWLNREKDAKVNAFDSWCPSHSGSRSATLQDVFGLAFGGRSLVLSFSSKLSVARALSTKPFLLKPSSPNHGFFWNGKAFESVYDKKKFTATSAQLLEVLENLQGLPFTLSQDRNALLVDVDGEQVALDLQVPEVAAFAAEVSYAFHLLRLLNVDNELKALVSDDIPDFFSFGFSVKDLEVKYGKGSSQLKAVATVFRNAVASFVASLNAAYNGQVLAEAIYLGSTTQAVDEQQIIEKTRSTLVSQLADEQNLEEYYPEVYLSKDLASEQKEEACSFLQQVLSPANVEVYCLPDPANFRSIRADVGNSTGDGKEADEIAIFHIVLWSSIVLILTVLWASAVMFTIDASKDTMIYNQHSHINIKTIS